MHFYVGQFIDKFFVANFIRWEIWLKLQRFSISYQSNHNGCRLFRIVITPNTVLRVSVQRNYFGVFVHVFIFSVIVSFCGNELNMNKTTNRLMWEITTDSDTQLIDYCVLCMGMLCCIWFSHAITPSRNKTSIQN